MKYSHDEKVKQARSNVYTAYLCYSTNSTDERQEELSQMKRALEDVYTTIFGEELNHKNKTNKHQESWTLISEITGRKTAKRAILKTPSKEEKVKNWHDYFMELLGKLLKITYEKETINTILDDSI